MLCKLVPRLRPALVYSQTHMQSTLGLFKDTRLRKYHPCDGTSLNYVKVLKSL